ncbi:protein translocase subunit SecD [Streptomyces sp. TRM 70351]|uniref:protein translocase subunit SecD n=1 Tax=Streptomyces sp. TRM 70351 TaxID=3116552 RepID=UPI002E7B1FDB|nr:protein translocase subunit SecD [Streptomyces sp. TRM 70351]MEE1929078.1 protein translocase subunit SecD [Streptomyces sp. TRM 70351]
MATPQKRRRSPAAQGRPWRALTLVIVLTALLTGGMFLSGATTPRLGIDLAGGTSITLTAKDQPGRPSAVNEANMNTAVSIIERRVNGLGVSEAEVKTQGDRNIIVNIPRGTDEKQAREQVGTTAELGFRPVLNAAPVTPPGQPQPGEEPGAEPSAPAASPSPSGEAPQDDEEAVAPEDETEQPQESAGPADGASPQGARAGVVTRDETESPGPGASASQEGESGEQSPPPAEQEQSPPPGEQGDPAQLAAALQQLDCSTPEARSDASQQVAAAKPTEQVVACDREGAFKYALGPVEVPGTNVEGADAVFDQQRGIWLVTMDFDSKGAQQFADVTQRISTLPQPQNQFAITLDGQVVSAPSVSTRIGGGQAEISGSFTQESAADLANVLKFGALPITFEEANVLTISPSLGGEQLKAGLIAGGIGLLLVVVYLLFYYRALALVAIGSLLLMGGLTYVVMSLLGPGIGFALSLPAVCGAIVAIGITADSFIVYFERIRDEVREGRSIRPAIERAWPRARHTILISDVVSFLAAVVLFFAAVGSVQGFAFVLGLTTLLDVLIVFLLTKPLTTLLARRSFFSNGHPMSGLDPKRLGARPPIRGRRATAATVTPKEA